MLGFGLTGHEDQLAIDRVRLERLPILTLMSGSAHVVSQYFRDGERPQSPVPVGSGRQSLTALGLSRFRNRAFVVKRKMQNEATAPPV